MLGVPSLAILDYDALMRREDTIELSGRKVKTSAIFFALQCTGQLESSKFNVDLLSMGADSEWYENTLLENLRDIVKSHGIFVFSSDIEGILQSPETGKNGKPLRALERILELVSKNSIPSEFYRMCDFLRNNVKQLPKYTEARPEQSFTKSQGHATFESL